MFNNNERRYYMNISRRGSEYYRWMRPKTYLFPGHEHGWRADRPLTAKVIWDAVKYAAQAASIDRRVSPHELRHYAALGIGVTRSARIWRCEGRRRVRFRSSPDTRICR